jgi:phospholipase A1
VTRLWLAALLLAANGAATAQAPQWLLTTAEPNVVAGQPFEVIVSAPQGETLDDKIDLRLKVGAQQSTLPLEASAPAEDGRRRYRGTLPTNLSGPVYADLPKYPSSVLVFMVATPGADAVQAFVTRRGRAGVAEPPLSEQDPMYFVLGTRGGASARFQLSFKYRLFDQTAGLGVDQPWLAGFYFGYTQASIWDLSEESRPFRDTSYRPSLFWKWERTDDKTWIDAVRLGVEHESNGGGVENSRSINTVFVRPEWRWSYADQSRVEFTPKFYYYFDKSDNPDIARYRGYVDWRARYDTGYNWIATGVVRVGTGNAGSVELDVSYRIRDLRFGPVGGYLHFQFFSGYGEDILDYNVRRKSQFRVGFAIVP